MESQDSLALLWLLRTVVALTLLPLALCLAGLLWAPIGASIAALYARHRNISTGDAASTAALASVHMLVPWVHVLLCIFDQRRRPVLERSLHIGALGLWLLGPISFLATIGCFVAADAIWEIFPGPSRRSSSVTDLFVKELIGSLAAIIMAGLGVFLWYRSLRRVGSVSGSERPEDFLLPMSVAHAIRMTILWSASSVAIFLFLLFTGLSYIGRG